MDFIRFRIFFSLSREEGKAFVVQILFVHRIALKGVRQG